MEKIIVLHNFQLQVINPTNIINLKYMMITDFKEENSKNQHFLSNSKLFILRHLLIQSAAF